MNPAPQTNPTNPQPAPADGRDASGRFAKGNPGGPGNPYPRRVAAFRQALLNCVTEEDIVAIAKAVIEEAKSGNIPAAKLIFHYVLGKPGDPVEACGFAPIANGSNGKVPEPQAAPIVNGSNDGASAAPSSLGPKAEQWLDRQMRLTTEALGTTSLVDSVLQRNK
jgi:hypothetical protein